MFLFINILFFSCVCLFVPGVYVIKIIIIITVKHDLQFLPRIDEIHNNFSLEPALCIFFYKSANSHQVTVLLLAKKRMRI